MDIQISKLQENKVHGSVMFPLNVYVDTHIDNNFLIGYHWHDELEIIYVEKGEFFLTVNMEPFKIRQGQCFIINSGYLHSAYSISEEDSVYHAVVFKLSILNSSIYDYCQSNFIDPLINKKFLFPLLIDGSSLWGSKVINEAIELIDVYKNKKIGWEINVKACLLKIISIIASYDKFIIQNTDNANLKDYKVAIIKRAINYIQSNYNTKIYIEDLAREINLHPNYLCKFFKKFTGKTIVEYINNYRIEKAAKLILAKEYKISEVCFEVGFENFSYFIKKFKQYKRCTPNKYKETNNI